jgi:ubiquinone biosynthesis O-methyltransferase
MTTTEFYDTYHQKNNRFARVINENNFTYFYILRTLRQACAQLTKKPAKQSAEQSWKGLRVLDVGCGVGALSLYLANQGAEVTGIDISERAIAIAKDAAVQTGLTKKVTFKKSTLQTASRGTYDFVLCSEVIEHIPDDQTFLSQLVSQLKPGGVLMLTTPLKDNLLYNIGYYDSFDQEVGHQRRYTAASIKALMTTAPLQVTYLDKVEGPLRNILFTSPLGFLIKGIKGFLVPIFHSIDEVSAYVFGPSDIQVVAVKQIAKEQ